MNEVIKIDCGRGVVKKELLDIIAATHGREVTLKEIRLMPYLLLQMMDHAGVSNAHIDSEEREILDGLLSRDEVYAVGERVFVNWNYYQLINRCIWDAYIHHRINDTKIEERKNE